MINLDSSNFDMKAVVRDIEHKVPFFDKDKPVLEVDFGTVFILDDVEDQSWWVSLGDGRQGRLDFAVPKSWRMPHIMRAIGAFDSATTAAKNGWNFDVPTGFSQHRVRVNKIRGVLTICKAFNLGG